MSEMSPPSGRGFTITPKMVTIAMLAVLAVVFVAQNTEKAKLKLFFFTVTMPRWIAFVLLLLVGAVIGYVGRGIRAKRAGG